MMLHYHRIQSKLLESWIWCMILLTRISMLSSSVFTPLFRKREQLNGCDYEQAFEFYDFYTKPAQNGVVRRNWLCHRSSEDRLRICVNIFKNLARTKSEVVGQLVNDAKRVDGRCHEEKIAYRSCDDVPVKLAVKMYKCPVTQLDWPLRDRPDLPLRDFYIIQGTSKNTVFIFNSATRDHLKVCASIEYNHELNERTSVIVSSKGWT